MPGAPAGPQLEVGTPAWGSVKCIPQVTPRLDEMTPPPLREMILCQLACWRRDRTAFLHSANTEKGCDGRTTVP